MPKAIKSGSGFSAFAAILLLLLPLVGTLTAQATSTPPIPTFAARPVYGWEGIRCTGMADFNGDGNLDVAVGGSNGELLIFFGTGKGTFRVGPETLISTQINRQLDFIVAADLNGDGRPDVVLVGPSDVYVALGNGDGTFGPPTVIPMANASGGLSLGDFNGDGKLDLALSTNTYTAPFVGGAVILLGRGDGTFGPALNTPLLPYGTWSIAAADLNGDRKLDLVVTEAGAANGSPAFNGLSVLLGNGDGTFGTPQNIPIKNGAVAVAIADLNHDGKPDLAVATPGRLAILLGNGDCTFRAPSYYPGGGVASVAVADVNGDGIPDVVTDLVAVYFGKGDGTFRQAVYYEAANGPEGSALGDLRHTGKPDIVTAALAGESFSVLLNRGNGTYADGVQVNLGVPLLNVAKGDFNGDGKPDLAVATSNGLTILRGTGQPASPFQVGQTITFSLAPLFVTAADFNGDGKLDLAVTLNNNAGTYQVAVVLGNGDGTFGAPLLSEGDSLMFSLGVGDFNGDGKLDIVTSGVSILLGNGDGTFHPPVPIDTVDSKFVTVGDFNGDGKLDFAVAAPSDNVYDAMIYLGNGDGTFQAPLQASTGRLPSAAAAADLNGDGNLDLVVVNGVYQGGCTAAGFAVLLGNGDGTFQPPQEYCQGFWITLWGVAVTDLNGDGKPDVVIADDGGAAASFYVNRGDGTFEFTGNFGTDYGPTYMVTGAFHTGSVAGKADVVTMNSDGTLSLLINTTR